MVALIWQCRRSFLKGRILKIFPRGSRRRSFVLLLRFVTLCLLGARRCYNLLEFICKQRLIL